MTRSKAPVAVGQLSLFNTRQYERVRVRSHYDIEDGYEAEEIWPPTVIESKDGSTPADDSITDREGNYSVIESKDGSTPADDSITASRKNAVNKYRPGGTARSGEYWRFSYKWYGKARHRHIPGGCCTNPIALGRAEKIGQAISLGATVEEVLKLIQNW